MSLSYYRTKFLSYLSIERSCSIQTITTYGKELSKFFTFLIVKNISNLSSVTTSLLREYFFYTKKSRSLSQTSISKVISIIKSFFNYLEEEEIISKNPSRKIRVPKKIYKIPKVISKIEFDILIKSIDFAPSRCRKNALITDREWTTVRGAFYRAGYNRDTKGGRF